MTSPETILPRGGFQKEKGEKRKQRKIDFKRKKEKKGSKGRLLAKHKYIHEHENEIDYFKPL
jgi:hypothetical protein